jgi:alpha-2-macroglobulin
MSRQLRGILAGLAAWAAACLAAPDSVRTQGAVPPPLRVMATTPTGALDSARAQASIRFSEPMVALAGSDADRVDYVTVTPAVDVAFHWPDTNVLVVTPRSGRFPFASTITITVAAGAPAMSGRRLPTAHAFTFATPAPRLRHAGLFPRIDPSTRRSIGTDLRVAFDGPVRVADVVPHVAVAYVPVTSSVPALSPAARRRMARVDAEGLKQRDAWAKRIASDLARRGTLPATLAPDQPATAEIVTLRLSEPPSSGSTIAVTASGVASPEGPLRRRTPDRVVAAMPQLFTVRGPDCPGACQPAEAALVASQLVTPQSLSLALVVTDITNPAAEQILEPSAPSPALPVYRMPTLHEFGYRLAPGHRYAVRVDAALKDVSGRPLGAPWLGVFDVTLPSSILGLATDGPAVWESANGPRLPVISRSLLDVRTRVSPVAPADVPRSESREGPAAHAATPSAVTPVAAPVDGSEQETFVDVSGALSAKGTGIVQFSADGGREASRQAGDAVTVTPRAFVTSTLVQVTNIGVTVRGHADRLVVLATRLDTGTPIGGAAVRILDRQGGDVWRGHTDGDGLAVATDVRRADSNAAPTVLVEHEGDVAYLGEPSTWSIGHERQPELVGVVFSDRGVYRPGETAQVKAFVQMATPRGLEPVPPGTSITLKVDRPGIDDERYEAPIGPTGGVEWAVPIPADAGVDEPTWLAVERTDRDHVWPTVGGSLLVKAVKPVEFQTTLEASEIRAGDRPGLAALVEARDLSDVALSRATAAWTVTRDRLVELPRVLADDPDFTYETSDDVVENRFDGSEDGTPFRLEERGELDAQGTLAARFELPAGLAGRGRFIVAAQITDASSQVLGQRKVVTVQPDAYLGVGHDDAALQARLPAVAVVARTSTGDHVPGIPVRVRVKPAGADDDAPGAVVLDAVTGPAPVTVRLPDTFRAVEVVVTVRAADDRAVMPTEVMLNPGGGAPALPVPPVADDLTATLDRERYAPGDRARLTIAAPKGFATALVTLERGGVLEAHVLRLDGGSATIDLPVGDSAAGGLQAVVTAVRGRIDMCCAAGRDDPGRPTTRVAAVDIPLDRADAELNVDVEAPATRRPGEKAAIAVRVRNARGLPASAEVTIWAVDEGLLALTNYQVPNPLEAMYDRGREWVGFADSRTRLLRRRLPQYMGELLQTSAGERSNALSVSGAQEEGADPDARRDFRPLAFWHGAVPTGPDGVARIEATLPDTLTTYRVIAIASAAGARFGGARAPITVAKPLMVRPALPRFLTRLDRAQIRVSVAASLRGRGTVVLESLTPELLRIGGGAQRIDLTDGGRALVTFPVEARGEGLARVRVVATVGAERDVVEKDLPVVEALITETSAAVGDAAPDAVETIHLPASLDRGAGQLDVELASTMLVGLGAAGDYVTSYPYACAEQTASRALVLVLASALGPRFTLAGGPIGDGARHREAQAAIERLESYHCEGGYGYWSGDCRLRSPYLSAYVVFVLQAAKRQGFALADATLTRDADELESALARRAPARGGFDDTAWRAFAAKVLVDAGRRPTASLDRLYAARETLPIFALAHLLDATAAIDADSPRVAELRRRVRNALTVGATAHVEEKTLAPYVWSWPSNLKSTAVVLDVLSRRGGLTADEARPIVSWLLGQRGKAGIWSGTQANLWSLVGLAAYQRAFESRRAVVTASAALESTELLKEALDLGRPLVSRRIPIAEVARLVAPGGRGRLTLTAAGTGPVFYATRLSVAHAARDVRPLAHGITIGRRYLPVVGGKDGAATTTFAPGDLVRVVLTVRLPENRTFVAVSDPLPAGLEVADTSLATAAPDVDEAGDSATTFFWWRSGFDRIERKDQRVDVFASTLPDGEHEVSYLARAVTPGTFFAAPTRAEAMYEPEVSGRGSGTTITVTPRP